MIAVNRQLLKNTFLLAEAESLKDAGFIAKDQYLSLKIKTPILKLQSNIFARFGFFLLGNMLYSSVIGLISLFTLDSYNSDFSSLFFVYGIIGIVATELLCKQNFFRYGFDDSFILGFQIFLYVAIGVSSESIPFVAISMLILGTIACLRYVHTFSAFFALVGITAFFVDLVIEGIFLEKIFLPFVLLFLSIGLYFTSKFLFKFKDSNLYEAAIETVHVYSLILGYISINYLAVRELSQQLLGFTIGENEDIAFSWLFYLLTFALPILYIFYALKRKNRSMLIIGLFSLAASVATIYYYYNVFTTESMLILGGFMLFAIAYFTIRKLKNKESGITFIKDRFTDGNSMLYAQAIIINSQMAAAPTSQTSDMPFGGGGFSGGGAGESF